jgi:hypothetical protein
MDIKLIRYADIDKVKWNSCVHYATNGNIFGYKWYLDTIAKEWDALVGGDYETILPLFITEHDHVLEQPALLRETGMYSINLMSRKRAENFLNAIPEQYSDLRIRLNEGIKVSEDLDFKIEELTNHQMILLEPYETLAQKYAPSTSSRLKKEYREHLLPSSNVKPEKIAQLFKDTRVSTFANETAFHAYQRIMYNALHRGWGATFGVTDKDKNILSAAFFIYSQGRVMQLVEATTPEGKEMGAYEYLIDNFIRSHAGRPMVLDFNSASDQYRAFGASPNTYLQIQKGTIPKPKVIASTQKTKKKSFWKFW